MEMDETEDQPDLPSGADLPSPGAGPVEGVDGVSLAAFASIESLPVGERLSFILHDLFGVQFEEIEALVRCSPFGACELAERGRARLRTSFTWTD